MKESYSLQYSDYKEMFQSEFVRKYNNPQSVWDEERAKALGKKLANTNKFCVESGVGYWIVSGELRPVSVAVAYFAKFVGKNISMNSQRKAIYEYRLSRRTRCNATEQELLMA